MVPLVLVPLPVSLILLVYQSLRMSVLSDWLRLEVSNSKVSFRRVITPVLTIYSDLTIRTEDRATWARWASDLVRPARQMMKGYRNTDRVQHKEIRALRHVQDLGPYTMSVIGMMKEDGVWPSGEA